MFEQELVNVFSLSAQVIIFTLIVYYCWRSERERICYSEDVKNSINF